MKCILILSAFVAIVGMAAVTTAHPQRVYVQKLPYYPPPTQAPRPIRVRRSPDDAPLSKGVSIATNSASGNLYSGPSNRVDAKVTQSQTHFPSGRIAEGSSGSIAWSNSHGVGASLSRDINKGVSDTFSKSVNLNLLNTDRNRLDAIYSQSNIRQNNGFGFNKNSGSLDWSNAGGHGANVGLSRFEGIGKQGSIGAHTNLFKSDNGNTRLDAYGGGSKWLSGPFENRREFNFGLTGSHSFRADMVNRCTNAAQLIRMYLSSIKATVTKMKSISYIPNTKIKYSSPKKLKAYEMKCVLILSAFVAVVAMATVTTAHPQRVYVQKLPYYPPPTQAPRPIRVRRSPDDAPLSKGVSIVTNSASGNLYSGPSNRVDAKVTQSQTHFPSGKIAEGSSGSIDWSNSLGVGASLSRDINKGVSDTFSKSVNLNLLNTDRNRLDAIYSQSNIRQNNGFDFNKNSGSLDWSNAGGHGANLGLSRFEGIGKQGSVSAHTNLFKSDDGNTRLDAYGGGSKWLSGPFENQRELNFGLTGSHSFRG
ncbi:uncharacterized protein LOC106086445 [Stomoxys calcitrans]|uniref:uncharacterized protein LOC106086445 n=1 Tax=Stomoxys calcitrans TaxID=35570 RepID=UPI0027E2AF66|nr:uncharacterized protein LOC106086445 [Stomoxys calcitrans]